MRAKYGVPVTEDADVAFRESLTDVGIVHLRLIDLEGRAFSASEANANPELLGEVPFVCAVTGFWVMAGYELVRTLREGLKGAKHWRWCKVNLDHIDAVVHQFEPVRMPLAKLQPPKNKNLHPVVYHFPRTVWGADDALGWEVAPGRDVTRRELSDALLKLIEEATGRV